MEIAVESFFEKRTSQQMSYKRFVLIYLIWISPTCSRSLNTSIMLFVLIGVRWSIGLLCFRKKKRFFDHSIAKSLSIVYNAIEKAQMKKFIRINPKIGVSVYAYVYSGINVFARVRPPAMGHSVGIRYTFTRWRKENITYGWWVENQNNEELWRINVSYDEEKSEEMWFSVFVKDSSGQEVWDTNNGWNYTAHLSSIPLNTYDECHPSIRQHEDTRQYPKTHKKSNRDSSEESDEDFIEEIWLNTNHALSP